MNIVLNDVLVVLVGILGVFFLFKTYDIYVGIILFLIETILAGIAWYFGVTSSVLVKVFVILCLVFPIVSYVYVIVFDPDPKMIVKIGYVLTLLVFLVLILLLSFSL